MFCSTCTCGRLRLPYLVRNISKKRQGTRIINANDLYLHQNEDDVHGPKAVREVMQQNKNKIKGLKLKNAIQGEILYGIHPVHLALTARKRKLNCLYVKERFYIKPVKQILEIASVLDMKKELVSTNELDVISGSRPHQGVCLDVSLLPVQEIDITDTGFWQSLRSKPHYPLWILPYKVQDTMNMGGILRTSYYLGIDQVILPTKQSAALSGSVSKASSGALEIMDIKTFKNHTMLVQFIQAWKENGGKVIGTTGDSECSKTIPVNNFVVDSPVLVIVGNEEKGVRDDILEMCDVNITVKKFMNLNSLVDSLNVSVATGIVLYTLMLNRKRS